MTTVLILKAAEHPIKSVTIFKSSKAEVVRTFKVDITKGQNKVEIKGLSSSIDTHSVRVSGLGDARLYDVVCTVEQSQKQGFPSVDFDDPAAERMRVLNAKKADIEKRKGVRETEAQVLWKYANSLTGEHIQPAQVLQFMGSYVAHNTKVTAAIAELEEELHGVLREIAQEEKKAKAKKGEAHGCVDIVIAADNDTTIDLVLTYLVDNAKWQPTYELHANTEGGKPSPQVKLHYRARITQRTGEDWNNTKLSLSTVSGGASRTIPSLKPVKISKFPHGDNLFGQKKGAPVPQVFNSFQPPTNTNRQGGLFGGGTFGQAPKSSSNVATGGGLFGSSNAGVVPPPHPHGTFASSGPSTFGFGGFNTQQQQQQTLLASYSQELSSATAAPLPDEDDADADADDLYGFETVGAAVTPAALDEPTTIVSETPVSVTFSVHGQSTIPSDGIDHQVAVAILPFESTISYVTVPKIDPRVYLQCRVKNTSDYRLLPGAVRVIFDDSFVSSTSINEITTGENFECTLGDDASTKVTYSRSSRNVKSDGGAFSETTNTTTYFTKIHVHNKHTFDIGELVVRDVIPICEDKLGQVILKKPAGLAKAKLDQVVTLQDGMKVSWIKTGASADTKADEPDKDGLFEWKWKVASGAKAVLEAEWDVKVPGMFKWNEVVSRG